MRCLEIKKKIYPQINRCISLCTHMQWGMALALRIDTGVEHEQNSVLPSLVGCWDTYNSEMRSISMGKSRIDLFIPAPQSISNYYFLNLSRKHFSYFNATFMQKFIFPQCWGCSEHETVARFVLLSNVFKDTGSRP